MPSLAGAPVLLVDDDSDVLDALATTLRPLQLSLRTALDAAEALQLLSGSPAHVVVSDFDMPGMDGIAFLRKVKESWPRTQRMLITGVADHHVVEAASALGEVDRFLTKPWEPAQLRIAMRSALSQFRLDVENAQLQEQALRKNEELEQLNASLEARVRQRTEQLARAKVEWERSFDAISDPLAIVGRDRRVRRANLAYARDRDIRTVPGMKCHEALFSRAEVCQGCPLDEVDRSNRGARSQVHIGRSTFRVVAYPLGTGEAVCSYRDVTAEEETNRRLLQSEKLTAAGQLAAGVAHEINNPLASILAFSQVMRAEAGRTAQDLEALKLIESSALRCKYIVETLLRFVRRPRQDERNPVDLNLVCEDAAALIRPQIKGLSVSLLVEHPQEQTWVHGNANHLAQVMVNLLQNAVHAVGTNGSIRVACGPRNDAMAVVVADDGPGIPRDVLARIFEPFFTTKPEGVGTGLGLSITHRIVEEHGGTIGVDSEPGQGTTFTILLPPLGGNA